MAESVDSFKDLEELGIDCEMDSLTEDFHKAADHLQKLASKLDQNLLLTLYGFYKQGLNGPCTTPKPGWFDTKAKYKWEAWKKLGNMSQNEAKKSYIEKIKVIDPDFEAGSKDSWVKVSTLCSNTSENDETKSIVDFIKENNCQAVVEALKSMKASLNCCDDEGLALIHWAADAGSANILKILIDNGADIDFKDVDGQTALHYAASCGHIESIKLLLSLNANRTIEDNDGSTPLDVASEDAVKELLAI